MRSRVMKMTTPKLILLRIYAITLGRVPLFSKLLRKILVRTLITDKKINAYNASANYFDWDDLRD